jgi:hypothetical protein
VKSQPGPPATVGGTAAAQARIVVWCRDCRHRVEPDPPELARWYGGGHLNPGNCTGGWSARSAAGGKGETEELDCSQVTDTVSVSDHQPQGGLQQMKRLLTGVAVCATLAFSTSAWAQFSPGGNAVGVPGPNPGGPGLTPYTTGPGQAPPYYAPYYYAPHAPSPAQVAPAAAPAASTYEPSAPPASYSSQRSRGRAAVSFADNSANQLNRQELDRLQAQNLPALSAAGLRPSAISTATLSTDSVSSDGVSSDGVSSDGIPANVVSSNGNNWGRSRIGRKDTGRGSALLPVMAAGASDGAKTRIKPRSCRPAEG